jgi:hypothetical protein
MRSPFCLSIFVSSVTFVITEQRKRKLGGRGLVRDTTMVEGQGNNIFGFEGSQAVPPSPSERVEACVQG